MENLGLKQSEFIYAYEVIKTMSELESDIMDMYTDNSSYAPIFNNKLDEVEGDSIKIGSFLDYRDP